MKIEKKINKYIRSLEGYVLGLGISSSAMQNEIARNEKITQCTLLEDMGKEDPKDKSKQKDLSINIRDLRKKWKWKKIDFMIAETETIFPYLKYFVKDSIYLSKTKIYLFGKPKEDILEKILSKYKRYKVDIQLDTCEDGIIVVIRNKETKKNKIKDSFYLIADTASEFMDRGSDILSS